MRLARALLVFAAATAPAGIAAAISVSEVPEVTETRVGTPFAVEIRANLDAPVLGWGLDVFTTGPVELREGPVIGPDWIPIQATDGDGLAAVAFPDGVSGEDVLLATLLYAGSAPGTVSFQASATVADPTEGFALDPSGFAIFGSGPPIEVTVRPIPEPAAALLLGAGLALLAARRRRA